MQFILSCYNIRKNILLSVFFFFSALGIIHSQSYTVTGIVTGSENNLPLPGVTVVVKDTTTGAIIDIYKYYLIIVSAYSNLFPIL